MKTLSFFLSGLLLVTSFSLAHEGHQHGLAVEGEQQPASEAVVKVAQSVAGSATKDAPTEASTGSGKYQFRYRADLSVLPKEIAQGIKRAHGGFAIAPSKEIYFGLEGTGIVRISADLKTMQIVNRSEAIQKGGLHNTTYTDRDGGRLIFPDNKRGEIHITSLDGEEIKTLGKPSAEINSYYGKKQNRYKPTDTEVGPNGVLHITDGYSASKFVLTADLDTGVYLKHLLGENAKTGSNQGRGPGKFSTCHGIVWDPTDELLVVADREHFLLQKFDLGGNYVTQVGVEGAMPCDVEYVDWNKEPLAVVPCLRGPKSTAGMIKLYRGDKIVSTLRPKRDLGLKAFQHIHHAIGVVVDKKLFILCYGWNPGCYAVLEHLP